jgi:hypothetical protein
MAPVHAGGHKKGGASNRLDRIRLLASRLMSDCFTAKPQLAGDRPVCVPREWSRGGVCVCVCEGVLQGVGIGDGNQRR